MATVLRDHEDPEQAIWRSDFPLDELPPVFTEIAKTLAGLTLCGWIPTDDYHPRAQNQNLVQVRTRDGVPGLLSCVWPPSDEVGEQLQCGPVWFGDEVTLWEADQMDCHSLHLQAGMCQVRIRIGENATFDLFASHTKLLARDEPLLQLFSRDVFVSTQKTVTTTQEKP